jgi:YHS domain-containing protein
MNHEEDSMAKDPVCGMTVDEKNAPASYVYKGTTYYFCHPGCKTQFERNPDQFLGK